MIKSILRLILIASLAPHAASQVTYTLIARTGDPAPGTSTCPPPNSGAFFAAFRPPVITTVNGDDRVAFVATLTGCESSTKGTGLWAQIGSSSLLLFARKQDPFVFGPSTCTLFEFDTGGSYFTTDESLGFHATLAGTGCPAEVAFVHTQNGLVPTMAIGDSVLGTPVSGFPQPFGIAPGGVLGAPAFLTAPSTPRAVLSAVYPNYTVMANTTMTAPTPPGGTINVIAFPSTGNQHTGPSFNQVGQAAFNCTLSSPAGEACIRANLSPSGLTVMASTSDQEPQPPNLWRFGNPCGCPEGF